MEKSKNFRKDCRRATFLIEKRQMGSISIAETAELSGHLAGCSFCRTFAQQSLLINQLLQKLATPSHAERSRLSDEQKSKMQQAIELKLNNDR